MGINAVRIPIPIEAILPTGAGKKYPDEKYGFMIKCYKNAMAHLKTVYEMGSKYRIAVYVTIVAKGEEEDQTPEDVQYYLGGIENVVKRFHREDSFIGIDINDGKFPKSLLGSYWRQAYDIIRKYSKDGLVILSDLGKWQDIERSEMWPRLSPN